MNDVELLYESGPVVVVAKPPGLLTQAPAGIDSMELRLKEFFRQRERLTGNVYLGVPHRLDRPASGAMVFGRNTRVTRRLAEQFEARRVNKVYWACLEGRFDVPSGSWDDYLRKVPGEARSEVVAADEAGARRAILHYRVVRQCDDWAWVEIELETGRTHQIRVQSASRGHAVLGDAQYGSSRPFGAAFDDERLRAIALHARQLGFEHPKSGEAVGVTAPLPAAWSELGIDAG